MPSFLKRMWIRFFKRPLHDVPDARVHATSVDVLDGGGGTLTLQGRTLAVRSADGGTERQLSLSAIQEVTVDVEAGTGETGPEAGAAEEAGKGRFCIHLHVDASDASSNSDASESTSSHSGDGAVSVASRPMGSAEPTRNRATTNGTAEREPGAGEAVCARFSADDQSAFRQLARLINARCQPASGLDAESNNASGVDDASDDADTTPSGDRHPIARLAFYAWPYRWTVAVYLCLLILEGGIALLPPYLTKVIIDQVLAPEQATQGTIGSLIDGMTPDTQLTLVVASLGVTYVSVHTLKIILGWKGGFLGVVVTRDVRADLFEKLQRLPMSFFDRVGVGSLISRVNQDAASIRGFLVRATKSMLVNLLRIVAVPVMLFVIDWRLALWSLVPIPPILFFSAFLWPRIRVWFSSMWARRSELNDLTKLLLEGIRTIKTYGQEERMRQRFERANDRECDTNVRAKRYMAAKFSSVAVLTDVGTLLVWLFGGAYVLGGTATLGTLVAFTTYLGMLYAPVQSLSRISRWWNKNATVAQRIFNVIDRTPENTDAPPLPSPVNGAISLDGVTFRYPSGTTALRDVSIDVQPGETLGLVGLNGAGKSSLVHLVTRLYAPTRGRVSIDGHDLSDVNPRSVRQQVGLVTQETTLFDRSIYENIAFGAPNADLGDVLEAAHAARAHDFIMQRPDGYDSVVGSEGTRLSGGEVQRVALARALVCDPDVLILDEPTASLDADASRSFLRTIDRAGRDRTTIIITHELSTLQQVDRLAVLKDGELVETGTHDELVAQDNHYAWLVGVYRDVNRGLLSTPQGTS